MRCTDNVLRPLTFPSLHPRPLSNGPKCRMEVVTGGSRRETSMVRFPVNPKNSEKLCITVYQKFFIHTRVEEFGSRCD